MLPNDPEEIRKKAEFDKALSSANVARMKGNYSEAELYIKMALELFPENLDAKEFAADLLMARGEWEAAKSMYKCIIDSDESRVGAQEKYAKVVIQIAEGKRQQDLLNYILENPKSYKRERKNSVLAAVISIVPGFGHVYCGQVMKGSIIFVSVMFCWMLFYFFSPNVDYLPQSKRALEFFKQMSVPALMAVVAAFMIHLYALIDAALVAEKIAKSEQEKLI